MEELGLYVQITKPDGTSYRWDGDGYAEDVPTGLSFTTKRGDGFSTFSCTLPRRIDEDYPDIELRDELAVHSAAGDTVWEGRVSAAPRSLDADSHSVDIQATGWMSSANDRPFVAVPVDRTGWEAIKLNRRAQFAAAGDPVDGAYTATATDGGIAFSGNTGNLVVDDSTAELVYTMPDGVSVAKLGYKGTQANTTSVESPTLYTSDLDTFASGVGTVALNLDGTVREATVTTPTKYAALQARASANHTPADAAPFSRTFTQIAVYDGSVDTHDISGEPDGVYASEVMAWIVESYCPKLTWAGNDSTYPIAHLPFRELTRPYEALLQCNRFHLLDLACWEGRTVHWAPVDLNDYDWVAYQEDPGFKVTLGGDAIDDQAAGIVVEYVHLQTGETRILWPDEHDELRDDDELNPANRHGDPAWIDRKLTNPCLEADALQMGRMLLAEHNQPKSPGEYTVEGYVRDRQGNWQPGWKVRALDRIVIADHPNRRPRLITETSWSHDSHSLTLATDSAIQRVDAYVDRVSTALAANGLT